MQADRSQIGRVVLLLVVILAVGVPVLYWAIGPSSDTARNEFTRTVVQILGGGALLASLYFTYRTLMENREANIQRDERSREANQINLNASLASQEANRVSARLTQEANLTDRFAKAVEQLASEHLEVRLGAIFALERLAKDSERDHATIMELLTAYVRERAPLRDEQEQGQQGGGGVVARARLATDIQAILTVISRRARWLGQGESFSLDLSRTNLANADLAGAHLEGANLLRAHLEGAHLLGAHLEGAHLHEAFLQRANLLGADLYQAHLEGADLWKTTGLTNEQLHGAQLDDKTRPPDYLKQMLSTDNAPNTLGSDESG